MTVIYQDEWVKLINARWQDVELPECDAVICDPPYSARTHEGQRTGSEIRMPTISYKGITNRDAIEMADSFSKFCAGWAVLFCDHLAFIWHEHAWNTLESQGWLTFAPVFLKSNPPPRFSGDGPAIALEFIHAARPREARFMSWGSLPGVYEFQVGGDRATRTIPGAKPLALMRAIVRDYSRPGDLVLDPFCGSGTTALACRLEGRRCMTVECDPATAEIARQRLSLMPLERPTGQTALFAGGEP